MGQDRIVLIEDNDADVWVMEECLRSVATNYEVVVLKDGDVALQFIENEQHATQPRPCVIVIDLHVPKHDGLEILAAIQRTPVLKHVPALIVSGALSLEAQRQIRASGVRYVEKPQTLVDYQDLANLVWALSKSTFGEAAGA